MSVPKKHHYVPEVYLKRFALNNAGDLYILAKDTKYNSRAKKRNVSQICYEENRYTINNDEIMRKMGIDDPVIIEKKAFEYEEKELSRLFDKIDYFEKFTKSEFDSLIRILVNLKHRNPSFSINLNNININNRGIGLIINKVKCKAIPLLKELGFNEYQSNVLLNNRANIAFAKFNDPDYKLNIYRQSLYQHEPVSEELIQQLISWEPYVFVTNYECPFITSDNPGFTMNYRDKIFNTNFDNIQAFVFPISPKSVLFLIKSHKKCCDIFKKFFYNNIDLITVKKINKAIADMANEIIIGHSKEQLELIGKLISDKK